MRALPVHVLLLVVPVVPAALVVDHLFKVDPRLLLVADDIQGVARGLGQLVPATQPPPVDSVTD